MHGSDERHSAVEIDVNPVMQMSPDGSFCNAGFSDNVNFYPCSEHVWHSTVLAIDIAFFKLH